MCIVAIGRGVTVESRLEHDISQFVLDVVGTRHFSIWVGIETRTECRGKVESRLEASATSNSRAYRVDSDKRSWLLYPLSIYLVVVSLFYQLCPGHNSCHDLLFFVYFPPLILGWLFCCLFSINLHHAHLGPHPDWLLCFFLCVCVFFVAP